MIEETGYKPSAQAQTLRTKRTNLIRGDYPEDQFRVHQPYGGGDQRCTVRAGYQLLLANTDNDEKEEVKYFVCWLRIRSMELS